MPCPDCEGGRITSPIAHYGFITITMVHHSYSTVFEVALENRLFLNNSDPDSDSDYYNAS
jgi:hypothetical protein